MEMFGPNFENYVEPSVNDVRPSPTSHLSSRAHSNSNLQVLDSVAPTAVVASSSDPAKGKKGKLAGKSTGLTYQFQIMESIGASSFLRTGVKNSRLCIPLFTVNRRPPSRHQKVR